MITIDNERCIQCGTCMEECHRSALSMEGETVVWASDKCMCCGHCMSVCPRDAIVMDGDGYDCETCEDIAFAKKPDAWMMRNLILARRSVRRYTDTPITEEQITRILEAGKYSPTSMNNQGNAFIVVESAEKRAELIADTYAAIKRLAAAGEIPAFFGKVCENYEADGVDRIYYNAPLIIFVFAMSDVDGAIAATTMGMQINAEKLGFCHERIPTNAFLDSEFAAKWQAPEGKKCVLALAIGESEMEFFCSVPRLDPPVVRF